MWLTHDKFHSFVESNWVNCPNLPAMCAITHKLKTLRYRLRDWNKKVFGNLAQRISACQNSLLDIQNDIELHGLPDDNVKRELQIHTELDLAPKQEEIHLRDKSRACWLLAGDRNSKFFHRKANIRKANVGIPSLKIDGQITTNLDAISRHVVEYYSGLFGHSTNIVPNKDRVKLIIPNLVSSEDNLELTRRPSADEIREAVFQMNWDSAPGPDGFIGKFYQCFWYLIANDVCRCIW